MLNNIAKGYIMDYNKIYQELMLKGKNRSKDVGLEGHHILPKSMGGNNSPTNIVFLTMREHFIAHKLLIKITTGNNKKKMIYAFWWMCKTRNVPDLSHKVSSRDYAYARTLYMEEHPNKDEERKERFRKNRAAGKYKYDDKKAALNLKTKLKSMSKEELLERMKKSAFNCDHEARALAIKKGKMSIIELTTLDGEIIIFDSLDKARAKEITGLTWGGLLYRLKKYNTLTTGEKIRYIQRFTHKGRYGTYNGNSQTITGDEK